MKKLLTVLLTLLMVFTLVGCNSKEDTPVVDEPIKQEEVVEPVKEEPEIVGGYVDVEDGTLTDELKDIFSSALEGLLGASYKPVKLVATQVVAGTNYKFLAEGTKTTNPITKGTYYITIYKDLQGNIELKDIETIEEKQEEALDLTGVKFWVVFYDQYDNELQREALVYGTVPSFKGNLPAGFKKWTNKKTGKDTNEFIPITTNTYFKAVCNNVYVSSNDSGSSDIPHSGCPNSGYKLDYIFEQQGFYSYVLEYSYNSGSYSFTGLLPIPVVLSSFTIGDWVHGGLPSGFVKCDYDHEISLPTLYDVTFEKGDNVKEMATAFYPAKAPAGSTYELIDGSLVLKYDGSTICQTFATVTAQDDCVLDNVFGQISGNTTIEFTATASTY